MPNIKTIGFTSSEVQELSKQATPELAKIIGCPADWITFIAETAEKDVIFCNGEVVQDTIFMQVEWFDRGQETKTALAKILSDLTVKLRNDVQIEYVDILFVDMEKTNYYENGAHF